MKGYKLIISYFYLYTTEIIVFVVYFLFSKEVEKSENSSNKKQEKKKEIPMANRARQRKTDSGAKPVQFRISIHQDSWV